MVTLPQLSRQDVASCLLMNHKEGNLEENLQYICIHPTTPALLCWDVRCEILAPLRVKILVWVVLDSNGALSGACLVFKGIIYQPRAMLQRCTKSRYVFTECGIFGSDDVIPFSLGSQVLRTDQCWVFPALSGIAYCYCSIFRP